MSQGTQLVESFLKRLEVERRSFNDHSSANAFRHLEDDFTDGASFAGNAESVRQKSLFGFVPAWDNKGNVYFYIRLGGPEMIQKGIGSDITLDLLTGMPEADAMAKFYGGHASSYSSKVDEIDGTDPQIYRTHDAYDRELIQRSLAEPDVGMSKLQIAERYPLRLAPSSGKFVLQYAKRSTSNYQNLDGNNDLLGAFIADIVQSAVTDIVYSSKSNAEKHTLVSSVLSTIKGSNASSDTQMISTYVLSTFVSDFATAISLHLKTYWDGTAGSADNNAYDHLYYYAFGQLINVGNKLSKANVRAIYQEAAKVLEGLSQLSSNFDYTKVASGAKFYFDFYVTNADIESAGNKRLSTFEKNNNALRRQNVRLKTKNEELVSPKKYRNVGMAAGLISSYMAVTQESAKDMDLWKKALIIAGGTGLGAIPYINFLSIATMPYLVDKGIELSGDEEFKARTRQRLTSAKEATAAAGRGLARAGRSARDRLRERRLGQDGIMEAEVVDVVEPLALPTPEGS